MKKYLSLFFVLALVLNLGVSMVSAQTDSSNTRAKWDLKENVKREVKRPEAIKEARKTFHAEIKTKREEFRGKLKTERDAFKTEIQAKKEEFKKLNTDKKREFCGKAKEMVTRRFEMAITELEKFQGRVSEVVLKLKAEGKDTTIVEEALALSKSKLAEAKTKLAEVKTLVPEGGCENMTPEIFEKIKLGAREAKDLLKESRESLREAIKAIKSLRGEKEIEDTEEAI